MLLKKRHYLLLQQLPVKPPMRVLLRRALYTIGSSRTGVKYTTLYRVVSRVRRAGTSCRTVWTCETAGIYCGRGPRSRLTCRSCSSGKSAIISRGPKTCRARISSRETSRWRRECLRKPTKYSISPLKPSFYPKNT